MYFKIVLTSFFFRWMCSHWFARGARGASRSYVPRRNTSTSCRWPVRNWTIASPFQISTLTFQLAATGVSTAQMRVFYATSSSSKLRQTATFRKIATNGRCRAHTKTSLKLRALLIIHYRNTNINRLSAELNLFQVQNGFVFLFDCVLSLLFRS